MPDAYTDTSALSSDTTAYEMLAYFALRPQLMFDQVATIKPTNQSHRGAAVTFTKYADFAAQTSELSQTADPDAIAADDDVVTVTLKEYGAVVKTTAKLRATSFLDIDADVANLVGYNAGLSHDTLARTPLAAGDNVRYGGSATSRDTVTSASPITANLVRRMRTDLKKASAMPVKGNLYAAFIEPDVAYDLRIETGAAAWRDPHVYSQPEQIWSGEIGAFEGFAFVETPRAPIYSNAGSSPTTTDVYGTIFVGGQALAVAHANSEGYGRLPTIVKGPRVDALQRIQPLGWKSLIGWARFREECLRRLETSSSIGG